MKLRRVILGVLMIALLLLSVADKCVFAKAATSGSCGENCRWSYENGVLRIAGKGAMDDYISGQLPWQSLVSSITEVDIQQGITSIGDYSFAGCSNLRTVTLPAGLATIGNFSFEGAGISELKLPDSLKQIGGYAFNGCTKLVAISIPKHVSEIMDYTFQDCANLQSIRFSGAVEAIGDGVFQRCIALKTIVLPQGLKEIGDEAFYGCSSLSSVTMPDGLKEVGSFVFGNCSALTKVTFPESVEVIGKRQFFNCENLTEIHLPDSLKVLEQLTFFNCAKLETIAVPESVTQIESNAFSYCENLNVVTFAGKMPTFDDNAFFESRVSAYYPVGDSSWKSMGQYGGKITWQGYYPNAVSLHIEVANKGAYPCGIKFPENDVKVIASLRDGSKLTLPRELYSVENWSSSSAGARTIRIRHGQLTQEHTFVFHKKVHITPNSTTYPQSEHDYLPNIDEAKTFFYPGAQSLTLQFSYDTSLGEGDTLTVYLSDGLELITFRGDEACGMMFTIPGDSFTIRLISDDIDCAYGYSFDSIEVDMLLHTQKSVPGKAPTCSESGYSEGIICKSCGLQLQVVQEIPALGHDWGAFIDTIKPSASNDGILTRTCYTCDEKETQRIDKNPFIDVKRGDQFEKAILWAYYGGVTKGTSDVEFSPESPCTRKQIVTFLWRAAGCPEPECLENPFTDVKEDQFQKAILWAYYEGITKGTTTTEFSPEATCTRKQIVTFLWRYRGSPVPEMTANPFTDVKDDQFKNAILWAYYKGITKGTDVNAFSPENHCTRKQIVTFLYRDLNS